MLTVYRASAGAGKTHALTGEYLGLLFTSPQAYRRILAVTFTNKATDEMKSRIVEELYRLASGQSSDYLFPLSRRFSLSDDDVRRKARTLLITLLHDYSSFNISTIDRFFQQTMRAFAREIGLQGGYSLELDQEQVLGEAIDNLLGSLDKEANKELLGWLVRFAADKVENGYAWNLREDIARLSRELFKESYKTFEKDVREDIADKNALERYRESLYAVIRFTESRVREIAGRALAVLESHRLSPDDFKNGSRSPIALFRKWAEGEMKEPTATFLNWIGDVDAWTTAKTPAEVRVRIEDAFAGGLNDCMRDMADLFVRLTPYLTAREIVRYYYTLGILNDISARIDAYRSEKNTMLIADTTELLNRVIEGCDAPFIYEKTGVNIDYFMIDEFQDTSGMQWNNFCPLIRESLAHDRFNLIVGDVKQSIYRFRNSDWKLLDEQLAADFRQEGVADRVLGVNWRSCRCIVEFNNAFFSTAPLLLQALYNEGLADSSLDEAEQESVGRKIVRAYDKLYQEVPPKFRDRAGHVRVRFFPDADEAGWKERVLKELPHTLERLQDNGYALRDIAILVRTNREGADVADALLAYQDACTDSRYKFDLISDDALFVSGSASVRFLLAVLRHLRNPEDETARRLAVFGYTLLRAASAGKTPEALPFRETAFPPEVKNALRALGRESLYETAEGLVRLFDPLFGSSEQVFIQAFLDLVHEFSRGENTDISGFLKWWEEKGVRKTVVTPDAQDAIRILTVHKSKGLGFRAVIVPFGDWEIDHKPTQPVILWCRPEQAPFDKLRLVPVRYGSGLSKTYFARDYYEEKLHAYIDNLNTLYVAFTRAKEELIVYAPQPKKADKAGTVADLLWLGLGSADRTTNSEGYPLTDLTRYFDRENGCFEYGDWWKPAPEGKTAGAEEIPLHRIVSVTPQDRLHLRLQGKIFLFDNRQRKHGALMHEVLCGIRTPDEIAPRVESFRYAGIITREESAQLSERLRALLEQPEAAAWYDGHARLLPQAHILSEGAPAGRPDRVMIGGKSVTMVDFRFGSRENPAFVRKMKEQVARVRQMGYAPVNGFVWYVELNKIEAVNEA